MDTFSIGFTQKNAEQFFGLLRKHEVRRVLDVRLHNTSQLAGFAKMPDLKFFLRELCQADYLALPELMPTAPLLKSYRQKLMSWDDYALRFLDLLDHRRVERDLDKQLFEGGCLLCSDHQPHYCHRCLALEYLNDRWQTNLNIVHLV
jgi:uncharacterized protein (DUF488 family)